MSREGGLSRWAQKAGQGSFFDALLRTRTVDSDGNALGEDIAISADKRRNLGKRVVLEVLRARVLRVGLDNLNVEVVGLRHGQDGC